MKPNFINVNLTDKKYKITITSSGWITIENKWEDDEKIHIKFSTLKEIINSYEKEFDKENKYV